jgi:serine/threonine protein kinase
LGYFNPIARPEALKKPIPFGKYYLLERINVGGMAEVFKAKAFGVEGFERLLAVKRILPNIAEDEEFITMFIDEAKIAVQLNHANIAQIFDLGKVDDSYFIALEYVSGRDLRGIFDRCRQLGEPMPIAQACFIIMKVCEGLDYAHNKRDAAGHELNLVHRDVSPQNVLISYEGEVKLIDFGIAKAAGKASKTQAGILKGKFGYMSPEQVRGLPIDRRSDIFSVGIVLYELLTGERLFVGESDFSTLEKVRNVEILPPSTYNRKIPEELERIVLKALAKDVDERYQNAIDLHDDLQAFMYSSGEFYARKDLAAWQKKTFAKEIEEETRKLDAQQKMLAPEAPPTPSPPMRRTSGQMPAMTPIQPGAPAAPLPPRNTLRGVGTGPPPPPAAAFNAPPPPAVAESAWQDEELATNIYDRPPDGDAPTPPPQTLPIEMRPAQMMPVVPGAVPEAAPHGPSGGWAAPAADGSMPRLSMPDTEDFGLGLALSDEAPSEVLRPVVAPPRKAPRSGGMGVALGVLAALILASAGAAYYFLVYARRPATLFLAANPVDAQVVIDDEKQTGTTPFTIRLRPGTHVIEIAKPGFLPFAQTVEVRAGQRLERIVQLEGLGQEAPAKVRVTSTPVGLKVKVDGTDVPGGTPLESTVKPGKHTLEVAVPGGPPWQTEFVAEAGKTRAIEVPAAGATPTVRAKITSTPAGAKVYLIVDAKRSYVGPTPAEIKLEPTKQYAVSVEQAGFKPFQQDLRADGKSEIAVEAVLEKAESAPPPEKVVVREPKPPKEPRAPKEPKEPKPPKEPKQPTKVAEGPDVKPPPAAAKTGFLRINSKPWTRIYIDGKDTGLTTPQTKISLPAGKHSVLLVNNPFNIKHTVGVTITAGETTTRVLDLRNPEQGGE